MLISADHSAVANLQPFRLVRQLRTNSKAHARAFSGGGALTRARAQQVAQRSEELCTRHRIVPCSQLRLTHRCERTRRGQTCRSSCGGSVSSRRTCCWRGARSSAGAGLPRARCACPPPPPRCCPSRPDRRCRAPGAMNESHHEHECAGALDAEDCGPGGLPRAGAAKRAGRSPSRSSGPLLPQPGLPHGAREPGRPPVLRAGRRRQPQGHAHRHGRRERTRHAEGRREAAAQVRTKCGGFPRSGLALLPARHTGAMRRCRRGRSAQVQPSLRLTPGGHVEFDLHVETKHVLSGA